MYADKITKSMQYTIDQTTYRRENKLPIIQNITLRQKHSIKVWIML